MFKLWIYGENYLLSILAEITNPKKCRARYGLDRQHEWCKPCRYVTCIKTCLVIISFLIVSMTKFLIVNGSPHAYLPCNRHAIMWVSKHRCPILTFCNWIPVSGYPCNLHLSSFTMFHSGLITINCCDLSWPVSTSDVYLYQDIF